MFSNRLPRPLPWNWNEESPRNTMWSLSWSLNRNTAPCAEPIPGATRASPAARSREYFFSNGMASARANGGFDHAGQVDPGGRRPAARDQRGAALAVAGLVESL